MTTPPTKEVFDMADKVNDPHRYGHPPEEHG